MIIRRIVCSVAVIIAGWSVISSVGESWDLIVPLVIGFSIVVASLCFLPPRCGAMISVTLLPWSTIIGSSKIYFPLGASVLVFQQAGSPLQLLFVYAVVSVANLLCLWNSFAPSARSFARPVVWSSIALSMMTIWYAHQGWSWLTIAVADWMILTLLDPRDEVASIEATKSKGRAAG